MNEVETSWNRYAAWLASNFPELHDNLNPGASDAQLTEIKTRLEAMGSAWPDALSDLYRLHDGQPYPYASLIFLSLYWLPLNEVIINQENWASLQMFNEELKVTHTSTPPNAIQTRYVNLKWIPFAHDGGGNHIGIDLDPGPNGTVGQVINFGRDQDDKFVIAQSLSAFLDWMLEKLESGRVRIVEDESMSTSSHKNFEIKPLLPERWMMGILSLLPK
jgi:cell wall assembly regulator SMI1